MRGLIWRFGRLALADYGFLGRGTLWDFHRPRIGCATIEWYSGAVC
jgi:hypothetical protein